MPILAKPSKRLHPSAKKSAVESPTKALAEKVRRAAEQKEIIKRTTLGLYSLKVGDSLFGIPFCAVDDSMALKAQKEILPQSNVYRVGSFCQYDGEVISLDKPCLVLDNKVD